MHSAITNSTNSDDCAEAELEAVDRDDQASSHSGEDDRPAVGPATELKFLASERERQSATKTELFEAARNNDVAGVRRALQRGGTSINAEDRTTCMWTPLHHAAEVGAVGVVAFLLRQARRPGPWRTPTPPPRPGPPPPPGARPHPRPRASSRGGRSAIRQRAPV